MKSIFSLILVSILLFGCKAGIKGTGGKVEESTGTGINTSRSNIKNDVDTKKTKSENKEKK